MWFAGADAAGRKDGDAAGVVGRWVAADGAAAARRKADYSEHSGQRERGALEETECDGGHEPSLKFILAALRGGCHSIIRN